MEYARTSAFTPLALAIVLLAGVTILVCPKRFVIPVLFAVCLFVSMRQRLVFASLDFMPHRILLLFGWTRILLKGEFRDYSWNRIDKILLLFTFWTALAYILLFGTLGAVINRLGDAFNTIGLYFLFRTLICSRGDMERVIASLGCIFVVLAGIMALEFVTRRNPLSVLGYVRDEVQSRMGRFRCQAAFGHPISAGVFGATVLPLWLACWWQKPALKKWAVAGMVASTVITLTSASSSPVVAYGAGLLGFCFWRFRGHLRAIRWATVFVLIALHLVMKAPVWALIARIDITAGNSGHHRYRLVDQFINCFSEWWLIGVKSTDHWGYNMGDLANQYVASGTKGGLLGLVLFVALLVACFRKVGQSVRLAGSDKANALLAWAFGAMLFSHCVSFLGFSYWDQIIVLWYLVLSMIASLQFVVFPDENPEEKARMPSLAFTGTHTGWNGVESP